MNELAHWMADVWDCVWCGKPCGPDEVDSEGEPIHEECRVDREGARTDRAYEMVREWRMNAQG